MSDIEERLQVIEQRNRRVESDKRWETSATRRLFIAAITYCTAAVFLWLISAGSPFINALVPTGGYLLSTLSLPWIKRLWLRKDIE